MHTLFAVVSTCLLEEPATQLQEIQDTQHAFSVCQYLCRLFLCSCCDRDQCKSLELSALIMAIVIALAEVFGGRYFIQQWTNSRFISRNCRLLIKCNLVEAHFCVNIESLYLLSSSTLEVKVFAQSPFGNQLFWFRETFNKLSRQLQNF